MHAKFNLKHIFIKRAIEHNVFSEDNSTSSIEELAEDLTQQAYISESTNAYYINFAGKDFYKLKGDEWSEFDTPTTEVDGIPVS